MDLAEIQSRFLAEYQGIYYLYKHLTYNPLIHYLTGFGTWNQRQILAVSIRQPLFQAARIWQDLTPLLNQRWQGTKNFFLLFDAYVQHSLCIRRGDCAA